MVAVVAVAHYSLKKKIIVGVLRLTGAIANGRESAIRSVCSSFVKVFIFYQQMALASVDQHSRVVKEEGKKRLKPRLRHQLHSGVGASLVCRV